MYNFLIKIYQSIVALFYEMQISYIKRKAENENVKQSVFCGKMRKNKKSKDQNVEYDIQYSINEV